MDSVVILVYKVYYFFLFFQVIFLAVAISVGPYK